MNIFPQRGVCYISGEAELKEEPTLKSNSLKRLKINEVVVYEGVFENDFGKWIFYREKENNTKRYILAENLKHVRFVKFPEIDDGVYAILHLGKKKALSSRNSIITLKNVDLKDNQKFIFQLIPKERLYKITCLSSGKELTIDSGNRNIIRECNSGAGIKWSINNFNEREFYLQANPTKKIMEIGSDENIYASNTEKNENKFFLIFLGKYNPNNIKNNKNIENDKKNVQEQDIENEEDVKEDDDEDDDYEETININENLSLLRNVEVQRLLDLKEKEKPILKFNSPKLIITKEDLNGISKNSIKHIEIDISVKAIEKNIFDEFINLESVYCHSRWINRFNRKNTKILNLKEVYIKEGVTQIKKRDFRYCTKLQKIYIPKTVTKIENNSFDNCLNLKLKYIICEDKWYKKFCIEVNDYEVPFGTKILKKKYFHNWKYLISVKIPSTVNQIENSCFERCLRLKEIILPDKITVIPENCFKNCRDLKRIKIPNGVTNIHPTAFIGCINLTIIEANDRIKKLFQKVLSIPKVKKYLKSEDYREYPNIETLEIPLQTEVDPRFFKNFKYLRIVNFDPFFFNFIDSKRVNVVIIPEGIKELNYMMFKSMVCLEYIEIPTSIKKIEENTFSDCVNVVSVKTQSKWINLFNKNILTSIILLDGELDIKKDIFSGCDNLESVVMPDEFNIFEDYLFRNCRRLRIIKYFSQKKKIFKSIYEVPNNIQKIKSEDYYSWANVGSLIVNENVKEIENNFLVNCDLEFVQMDPKFLKYIPKSEIVCIIVPEFVKNIDERDFSGCKKLKKLIILGDALFKGNRCKDLEQISILECNPYVLKNAKNNIRDTIGKIIILDGSATLDYECLKNYKKLTDIFFPDSIKFIGGKCFYGCEKLKKIYIPETIKIIHEDAFENCNKLATASIISKYLKCLPKDSICHLKILDRVKKLDNIDFSRFKNLKKIEFPNVVEKIVSNNFRNCPNLREISCSKNLFSNLDKEDKKNYQNVEIKDLDGDFSQNIFNNCPNLENINIPYTEKLNKIQSKKQATSIDEIIDKDKNNLKYRPYLFAILDGINSDRNKINGVVNSLEEISHCIIDVCIRIKNFTKQKNKIMIPHPVQCITILRICDEILNSGKKGAIAEVKTGEGKSFIISVIAIVLKMHGRIIDVVTSNLELAIRDESDQKEYYQLFGIGSGVLINIISDKNFTSMIKSEINMDEKRKKKNFGFNLEVFSNPIVYSTNYNFQFVYLHSLFNPENLRKREYDVVIVDEVDNMLLDQSSSPAIIAQSIDYLYYKDVLEIIYMVRNKPVEEIYDIIHYYFPKGIDLEKEKLIKLLDSVFIAEKYECDIDYVVSKENKIYIIDHTTGYVKPGSRWERGIHEFVEIKEQKKLENSTISTCSITQCTFFNMYRSITGLSGTLGSLKDQEILKESYGLNLFHIPRNLISNVPIYHKERPNNDFRLFSEIEYEIVELITKRRPVLVIFKYIKQVNNFILYLMYTGTYQKIQNRSGISKILGEEPSSDKKSIQIAGKSGHVTIATAAAGRGMDIKLDQKSLESGGLHVILPYKMENERVFWQCVGRCGRQGQPGSVTEYISENDKYYDSRDFDQKYENLSKLQNKFAQFLRTKWSWIYKYESSYGLNVQIPFGCSIDKMIGIYINKTAMVNPRENPDILTGYYRSMILLAWGMFYTNISENLENYSSYEQMEEEYNNNFMSQLTKWIPEDCDSLIKANISISNEMIKRIDWIEVILFGLDIVDIIATFGAPEVKIGITIFKNGLTVLNNLLNGRQINWFEILKETGLSLLNLKTVSKFTLPVEKIFKNGKLMNFGIKQINRFIEFNKRIDNKLLGRLVKGIGKDIWDRKDDYLNAIGDIATDISRGENPTGKILNMVAEGVYNGISNSTIDFIKEKTKKLYPENHDLLKEILVNNAKLWFDFGHDVIFDSVDIENALRYRVYKNLKDPLTTVWKDKKFKKSPMMKAIVDTLEDNFDSTIETLVKKNNITILPNGKINDQVIQEILEKYPENAKDNFVSGIKKAIEDYKEEKKRKKELNDSINI